MAASGDGSAKISNSEAVFAQAERTGRRRATARMSQARRSDDEMEQDRLIACVPRMHRQSERERKQQYDKLRPSAAGRLYGWRWQRERAAFLARPENVLCVHCKRMGKLTPAREVDHIIPHRGDLTLFWDQSNWQGLCTTHHSAKTASETLSANGQARPDWLPRPSCRVTLVCGPPGSGKNTYVAAHKGAADIVIDLDEIKAELSGGPIYSAGEEWIGPALAERNRRLARLAMEPPARHAWVIVSAPASGQRQWWQELLGADDVVLLDVSPDECKRRIRADSRRGAWQSKMAHIRAVDEWWAIERGLMRAKSLKSGCDAQGWPTDPAHEWNR